MTPEQFRDSIDEIGWSLRSLSTRLAVAETTVHRWARGQSRIPQEVDRWLTKLAAAHEHYSTPKLSLYNPGKKD